MQTTETTTTSAIRPLMPTTDDEIETCRASANDPADPLHRHATAVLESLACKECGEIMMTSDEPDQFSCPVCEATHVDRGRLSTAFSAYIDTAMKHTAQTT